MLYLARRHLNYDAETFRSLPWWTQKLYESHLRGEFSEAFEAV